MRLFWKIYLASLGSVLFCTVFLTAIITYLEAEHSLGRLRAEQRLLAVTAASQVEAGYHDEIWPFELLSAISKEPDFVSWQIVDGNGVVVLLDKPMSTAGASALDAASIGTTLEPRRITLPASKGAAATATASSEEYWVIPMRMRTQRRPWMFRLGFHTRSVRDQIDKIVLTNVSVSIVIAILFVGISLVITRRFLGPLNALTEAATQMGSGDLDVSLPDCGASAKNGGRNDEIGRLVRSFSAMASRIKERDSKIQEQVESLECAKDELESRVDKRTQELHRAKLLAESSAASLHESEMRMRSIIEYAGEAIITLDDCGRIEVFNPAAAKVFGYTPQEVIGTSFDDLLPPGYSIDLAKLTITITNPESDAPPTVVGHSGEICGLRKDGTSCPLDFSLSEVHLEEKSLFTAIVSDISDRKRAEALHQELNQRLVSASRQAGMAEVASDVLHNVGNVLNSVNVSATIVAEKVKRSRFASLEKATALLRKHEGDLGAFLTLDKRGKLLPAYLEKLAETVAAEQASVLVELSSLIKDVDHIKSIVSMQQSYARLPPSLADLREPLSLADSVEDALRITDGSLERQGVSIVREYDRSAPTAMLDRNKVLHILVNLIGNAKHSLATPSSSTTTTTNNPVDDHRDRELRVRIVVEGSTHINVEVIDNGVGIPKENLLRVFNHGFTTKKDGHGFGLHSAALAATEMGGSLSAKSEGVGCGATFVLRLPIGAGGMPKPLTAAA